MNRRHKVKVQMSAPPDVLDPLLTDLAACIARSKRVLIITGAGISCSSGIPDFRSKHGLFHRIKERHPQTVMKGADLFDATLFRDADRTKCFYTWMAELKSLVASAKPTPTHAFIQQMQTSGQLLRCYTQNIDGLEEALGLPVVQWHGTMGRVKCVLCMASFPFTHDYIDVFRKGEAPNCPKCVSLESERLRLGKRQLATGTLRPDIVLYNEDHPHSAAIGQCQITDLRKHPDLMIVMGTSLTVTGVKAFLRHAAQAIHSQRHGRVIFVNRTPPAKMWDDVFDYEVLGDTDYWVSLTQAKLADMEALALAQRRLKHIDAMLQAQRAQKADAPTKSKAKAPARAKSQRTAKAKSTKTATQAIQRPQSTTRRKIRRSARLRFTVTGAARGCHPMTCRRRPSRPYQS